MDKRYETVDDMRHDISHNHDTNADVNNDLAGNDGIDLNNNPNTDKIKKNSIGTRIGALAQVPLAVSGGDVYDDGKFDPNAQIETEELGNALQGPGYAEYTDAPERFNLDLNEQLAQYSQQEGFEIKLPEDGFTNTENVEMSNQNDDSISTDSTTSALEQPSDSDSLEENNE